MCMVLKNNGTQAGFFFSSFFLILCFAYSLMEFGPDEEYVFYCQTRNARFVCLDVGLQEDVFMLHKPIMLRVVLEGLCFR